MFLGRVVGHVWASAKNPGLTGQRLLIVQPLDAAMAPAGRRLICTDAAGAGAGEIVYWVRGREASFPFTDADVASDATIVGIVDEVRTRKPEASA